MGRQRPQRRSQRRSRGARAVGLRRAARGDRPFAAALVVLVVLLAAMALGPLQRYTAAADRVESLQETRHQLLEQVERLEERRATLEDPEELELIARTELGLVKPGEVPYVVVPPPAPPGPEQVRPEPPDEAAVEGGPWYRRLGRAVSGLFDTDG